MPFPNARFATVVRLTDGGCNRFTANHASRDVPGEQSPLSTNVGGNGAFAPTGKVDRSVRARGHRVHGRQGRSPARLTSRPAEVTRNITSVNNAAESAAASANRVLSSASELASQSDKLRAEMDRFLATVRAA